MITRPDIHSSMANPFTLKARILSIRHALDGLVVLIQTQPNAWLHLLATIIAISVGIALELSVAEWRWIVLAIALVWVAELFNTAIEFLCDVVSPDLQEGIKKTKDLAAAAVLIAATGAIVIGLLVFVPKLAAL